MPKDLCREARPAGMISANAVLWASCLTVLTVGINSTAIMAALPTMRSEVPLSATGVQWAVNAYLIVAAACIVAGGDAAGRIGDCAAAIAGVVLFALGSSVIALSGSQAVLLAGRALQGFGAAFAMPATMAAVGATAGRRAAAIAAWTGFLMLGFSLGPLVGGVLTEFAGWRVIFWLSVPLMLAAALGLAIGRRMGAPGADASRRGADPAGFALLVIFMVALVCALEALPRAKAAPLVPIGLLLLALAALAGLLAVERRVPAPLVDLSLFQRRAFVLGLAIGALMMFDIISLLLFYNIYAQSRVGLGLGPLAAGASLLPLGAALLAVSLGTAGAVARFGLRAAMTAGTGLVIVAAAILAFAAARSSLAALAIGFVVMGAGLALPYACAPRLALGSLAGREAGQASGLFNAGTFLGGSIGVALGAIVFGLGGFTAALAMIAAAALVGMALSRMIANDG